jgi:response regulator RpfG family c-di-GMP phosphodiesterase
LKGDGLVDKATDIRKKYTSELGDIEYILKNLENGRYYENSRAKMDGYLATNIAKLRKNINDLVEKIEYNLDSTSEELGKALNSIEIYRDKRTVHLGSDVTDPK